MDFFVIINHKLNERMTVEFELEPHEYGVIFKEFAKGSISVDENFVTLVKHTIRDEFKGHRSVVSYCTVYGDRVLGETIGVDNMKKGCFLDVTFNPGIGDEEAEELAEFKKYSPLWNDIWNEIKTTGVITLTYTKHGKKADVPEVLLRRVQKCINRSIDAYTHFLI